MKKKKRRVMNMEETKKELKAEGKVRSTKHTKKEELKVRDYMDMLSTWITGYS